MKKVVSLILTLCALWAGSRSLETNSVSAQTNGLGNMPFTLNDVFGFTNTVVQVTNLSSLQMSNFVTLLLNLQTNVEETLPALSLVLSNAAVANRNVSSSPQTEFQGPVAPITSNPPTLVPAPNLGGANQQMFSLVVGTNVFTIDPPTLQALVTLRDNLEQTLPVLQGLNGTTPPPPTNVPPVTFSNPPVTGFTQPFTNMVFVPLTNQSHFVGNVSGF